MVRGGVEPYWKKRHLPTLSPFFYFMYVGFIFYQKKLTCSDADALNAGRSQRACNALNCLL